MPKIIVGLGAALLVVFNISSSHALSIEVCQTILDELYWTDWSDCYDWCSGRYRDSVEYRNSCEWLCERYGGKISSLTYVSADEIYNDVAYHCDLCQSGQYFDGFYCNECDPGTYMDDFDHLNHSCKECEPGNYIDYSGAFECYPCPEGTYSDYSGASYCEPCEDGTYSLLMDGNSYCSSCPSDGAGGITPKSAEGDWNNTSVDWFGAGRINEYSCYLPANIAGSDTTGTYTYTSDCWWGGD